MQLHSQWVSWSSLVVLWGVIRTAHGKRIIPGMSLHNIYFMVRRRPLCHLRLHADFRGPRAGNNANGCGSVFQNNLKPKSAVLPHLFLGGFTAELRSRTSRISTPRPGERARQGGARPRWPPQRVHAARQRLPQVCGPKTCFVWHTPHRVRSARRLCGSAKSRVFVFFYYFSRGASARKCMSLAV